MSTATSFRGIAGVANTSCGSLVKTVWPPSASVVVATTRTSRPVTVKPAASVAPLAPTEASRFCQFGACAVPRLTCHW